MLQTAKWRTILTGSGSRGTDEPEVRLTIGRIAAEASNCWDSMNKDKNRNYLWSDVSDASGTAAVSSELTVL
ncbi:hypothetical protein OB236_20720 [Paenibacillus sp. WQ 127069]|uniref:Uncharacterized protein n=1 Tax=Paenibacillus baimaensis TaxID=2982185 RepID=A0ABT2UIR5_9BACL|nr:hypothetical protein [Paenibacillus sp. WQ 127069]